MAKDPSQTKIPRLDGVNVPNITTRIPMASTASIRQPSTKTSKIAKPTAGLLGLRVQASSLLPKSLSTEKICQASNLVRKTTNQIFQNRFTKPPLTIDIEQQDSNKMIVDDETPDNNVTKIIAAMDSSKVLTRSETFTRECDDDEKEKFLELTHNITHSDNVNNLTHQLPDRCLQNTMTIINDDGPVEKLRSDTINLTRQRFDSSNLICDTTESLLHSSIVRNSTMVDEKQLLFTNTLDDNSAFSGLDLDETIQPLDRTKSVAQQRLPKKAKVLNSTMLQCDNLLDLTEVVISPARQFMNISNELNGSAAVAQQNNTQLLYMTQTSETIEDRTLCAGDGELDLQQLDCSDEVMDCDDRIFAEQIPQQINSATMDLLNSKPRYSFGLDLTECTLDCSIELCDSSVTSSAAHPSSPSSGGPNMPVLRKQNSFEMDESLGILTPDQMKEFLDSNTTNTNLDLPLKFPEKLAMHQCRIDQTPSPEELPLDPVEVKTDLSDDILMMTSSAAGASGIIGANSDSQHLMQQQYHQEQQLSQTDSYSKTDQMTKSAASSKVSNSFITSVTSITSLDTGYQGDGEMSRPASRGGDHSPSNMPRANAIRPVLGQHEQSFNNNNNQNIPIVRRQDPMTDSDFFTESDAEDVVHRGDRRAQIIDGQLYGAATAAGANVYVNNQQASSSSQAETDSCMESSGIFTDVENRADEDMLRQHRVEIDSDMSPDGSTDTIKSTEYNKKPNIKTDDKFIDPNNINNNQNQGHIIVGMSDSTTSLTLHNDKSDCSSGGGDRKSFISNNDDVSASTVGVVADDVSITKSNIIKATTTAATTQALSNKKSTSSNSCKLKKTSPSRKQNKNEANVALKKHEMSKRCGVEVGGGGVNSAGGGGSVTKTSLGKLKLPPKSSSLDIGDLIENQENKRPKEKQTSSSASSSSVSVRKAIPNKWDAVMNKIAMNKTVVKTKNYNDVKSKVTCGKIAKRGDSPGLLKSPSAIDPQQLMVVASCDQQNSTSSVKRFLQCSSKRGRTHSKDSQQSSQSDISLDGSTKVSSPSSISNIRSAKKRDVRTISVSPSDLGPPTKSNGNAKQINIKPLITQTNQKRFSPNGPISSTPLSSAGSTAPTVTPIDTKSSSIQSSKKQPIKRTQQQLVSKSPLKDHNRFVGPTAATTPSPKGTLSPKATLKNVTTILPPVTQVSTNRHHSVVTNATNRNGTAEGLHQTNKLQTNSNQIGRIVNNGKLSNGLNGHSLLSTIVPPAPPATDLKSNAAAVENLLHANKGAEALGVLIQYLVFHLDAFSTPHLKKSNEQSKKSLIEAKLLLDDANLVRGNLEDELIEKDVYYGNREKELQELHRCEIEKAQTSLSELERSAKDRIQALETQLTDKQLQQDHLQKLLEQIRGERSEQETRLTLAKNKEVELLKRISELSSSENELREKFHASETEFGERVQASAIRERELIEKNSQLNRQLDGINREAEDRRLALEEKLKLYEDEIVVLRHSRTSLNTSNGPTTNSVQQLLSSPKSPQNATSNRPQMLQDEIESLRCVLELKQSEISGLHKQFHDVQKAADALPAALVKVSALESRLEDLQIQLKSKTEEEKDLLNRNKQLQDMYSHESKNRSRLSLHNEELQYKLKQNSEKFALALTELSKSYHSELLEETRQSLYGQENCTTADFLFKSNSSDCSYNQLMDDISPPTSPVIKGVVEKSDSVSWVLEINDGESAEALASRMVRRAGSFRSSFNERVPLTPTAKQRNGSANALSQSASATSILRQHSETSPTAQKYPINSRRRSKSVSTKSIGEQTTANHQLDVPAWNQNGPICSSSPNNSKRARNVESSAEQQELLSEESEQDDECSPNLRSRSNSQSGDDEQQYPQFRRCNAFKQTKRGLITCNTAALTSKRPELCPTLPTHPSVQELKKFQLIKESAGEAMVSGTNSEDETSTTSSDGSLSAASSRSNISTSSNSVSRMAERNAANGVVVGGGNDKSVTITGLGRRRSSCEDELMHKIVASLGGTPMEVSWSEDGDQCCYPNESNV